MNITGKNIKTFRQKNAWSQSVVARKLGISIPAFSKIETGITDINISRLNELADLFGVSTMDLISRNSENPPDDIEDINKLKTKIKEREEEIISLQKKIINLYEEIRETSKTK